MAAVNEKEEDAKNGVAYYLSEFRKLQPQSQTKGKLIFRGLGNISHGIISSAGRRLRVKSSKQDEFIRYHVNLVANARKYGYGGIGLNSKLSDLEILAEIQHYGGATCLTDFSTNFLVALWFATATEYDKETREEIKNNGVIYWLDLGEELNFNSISYYTESVGIDKIQNILTHVVSSFEAKQRKVEPCFWLWEPTKLNNRIIKQDSVFMFGLPAFKANDNLDLCEGGLRIKRMPILSEHKKGIREELESLLGISAESVFYDIPGYSLNANGASVPIGINLLSRKECLLIAKENYKKGEYSLAISYLDGAIECSISNKNSTVKKCNREIGGCSCNLGELMFWRGRVNEVKKYTEEAILDYYEAIKIYKELLKCIGTLDHASYYRFLCESLRRLSILYYQKKDYNGAVKADKELWILYCNNYLLNDKKEEEYDNGADSIFALLELSIMLFEKEKFDIYLEKAKSVNVTLTNGSILYFYLEEIGKIIFNSEVTDIDKLFNKIDDKIEIIKANMDKKNISVIGYYYWNYNDMIDWIYNNQKKDNETLKYNNLETKKENQQKDKKVKYEEFISSNAENLLLLTKKVYDAQNKLLNYTFKNSNAFKPLKKQPNPHEMPENNFG